MKQLGLIVASDIYLNARASCSYLWADFDKIWHEWSSHRWEMTEMVKLMITHIFRPPPSPQNCIFLIYGPIFIRFGINGPDINVK